MRAQYYYFVAGLPALSLDDTKSQITSAQFAEQAKSQLNRSDFKLLRLLCLPDDADDLARIIFGKENEGRPIPEETLAFWKHYITLMRAQAADTGDPLEKEYKAWPDFWHKIVLDAFRAEEMPDFQDFRHQLLAASHAHCGDHRNSFLKRWYGFNRDLQNILSALNGRKFEVDFSRWLVGSDELTEHLSQNKSADFGLGKSHELFEKVLRVWDQENVILRERGFDLIRWNWVSDFNFFNYFNIDRILGYYAQLRILERWLLLDPEQGKQTFDGVMDSLGKSFSFPDIFKLKSRFKKIENIEG